MTETYLVSLPLDERQTVIDRWVERLYDHSESLYEESSVPELDRICEDGPKACLALPQGEKDPLPRDVVAELLDKRDEWRLENPDILRFFREFRKTVNDVADRGGDPGSPVREELHAQLEPCVEAGVIHFVDELAGRSR